MKRKPAKKISKRASGNPKIGNRAIEPEVVVDEVTIGEGDADLGVSDPSDVRDGDLLVEGENFSDAINAEVVAGSEDAGGEDPGGDDHDGDAEQNPGRAASAPSTRALSLRAGSSAGGRDALGTYLRELAQYPTISREEEHDLAVKFLTDKDRAAAYKLVTSNLWLVVKLAREYERAARNVLDLIQEGNIGLMEAVKNFDPYRGVRFPSYATWWVRAYIIRYLIANWRMVKIGTTQAQRKLFFNLKREKDKLEREGFYPAPKLLAEKLNVRESDVVEMQQRLGVGDASLDAPMSSEGGAEQTLHGLLPSAGEDIEAVVASRQTQRIIAQAVDDFLKLQNERERYIFEQRILRGESTTLQEVAVKLKISRERVRQIEERLRSKLRVFMRERLGDEADSFGLGNFGLVSPNVVISAGPVEVNPTGGRKK